MEMGILWGKEKEGMEEWVVGGGGEGVIWLGYTRLDIEKEGIFISGPKSL